MTLRRISLNEKSGFPTIKTVFMRSRIIVGATGLLVILVITLNYWETSSQNNNLARQVDTLEESLKLSAAKQEELEEELGLSKNSYDQCKRDQKEVSVELDTCKKETVERESQISKLQTDISHMETTVASLQKTEKELEGSLKKQADQIQEFERQLQSKAAALTAVETQLKQAETLKESLNLDVRNLQDRIKSLENQQLSVNLNGPDSSKINSDQPGVHNASAAVAQADSVPNRYQKVDDESALKEETKNKEALGPEQPVEGLNLEDDTLLADPKLEAPPKPDRVDSELANAGDGQAVLKASQLRDDVHADAGKNEGVNGLLGEQRLQDPEEANLQQNMEDDQGLVVKDPLNNNDGGDTNNEIIVDGAAIGEELPGKDKAAAAAKHLEEEGGEDDNELLEDEREPPLG